MLALDMEDSGLLMSSLNGSIRRSLKTDEFHLQRLLPLRSEERVLKHSLFQRLRFLHFVTVSSHPALVIDGSKMHFELKKRESWRNRTSWIERRSSQET